MNRLGWVLAAALGLSCAVHARALVRPRPGLATLPIFVPVSLEYEREMRAARGQPAGRGGEEAVELARALSEIELDGATKAALAPRIAALRDTRARLLDARGRRHALNIAMMDVGVALTTELTPAQWDRIHMRRDELQARPEAEIFDRLLKKLQ